MKDKLGNFTMSINSLTPDPSDPTIKQAKMSIFTIDEISGNGQVITEEVAKGCINTLIGKRICCKYIPSEMNDGEDALGSHEMYQGVDREGNDVIRTNTEAIGFITNVYIEDKVVMADANIWCDDHYQDICALLAEWLDNGVNVNMSCEYYYCNYNVVDNVEYIQLPIVFNAHTLLNSEDRGDVMEVLPAYKDAKLMSLNELDKWNKAVASLNSKNNKESESKDMSNIFLKALSEAGLSIEDKRCILVKAIEEKGYENVWIPTSGMYDDVVVFETYERNAGTYKNYKINYSINEDGTYSVDAESVTEVVQQTKWVSVGDLISKNSELTSELETANNNISEKEEKIKELNQLIVTLQEKSNNSVEGSVVDELKETIKTLNSQVESMKPIVDEYNEKKFNEALEKACNSYRKTFENLNAIDAYNDEATQELIKKSVDFDKTVSENAIASLNAIIVENVANMTISQNSLKDEKVDSDDLLSDNLNISINELNKGEDVSDLLSDEDTILKNEYGI